ATSSTMRPSSSITRISAMGLCPFLVLGGERAGGGERRQESRLDLVGQAGDLRRLALADRGLERLRDGGEVHGAETAAGADQAVREPLGLLAPIGREMGAQIARRMAELA